MRYGTGLAALVAGAIWGASGVAEAADVFTINANVCETDVEACRNGAVDYGVFVGTNNAEALFNTLDTETLGRLAAEQSGGQFDGNEEVFATIDYRGLPLFAGFPSVNGTTLCVTIDGIDNNTGNRLAAECGSSEFAFVAETRDQAIDDFVEYLKTNEDGTASRLNQQLARRSPNDPVAGNPGSMQSQAANSDFNQSFTQRVSQVWGCSTGASASEKLMLAKAGFGCVSDVADLNFKRPLVQVAQLGGPASDATDLGLYDDYFSRIERERGENKFALGLDYAMITASAGSGRELETTVLTIPLSYTVVFNNDPRKKFTVRLPISLIDSEGASSYRGMLSLAYSHPVNDAWSLTPSLGYSAAGSEDLGSAAALLSYSLSSAYSFDVGGWAFNIGNTIGQYSTQKVKVGDYESDPDISNTVFTNGLLISGPSSLLANDLVVEYYINDTRFTGDELFTDNAQEIGINFGKLNTRNEVVTSYIKGGVSYTMASGDNDNEADVLRLSLQFKF